MNITTIGLDLAKSVFQVHGVDAPGCGSQVASTVADAAVFRQVASLPGRHGGLRHVTLLGARAD
jgi:hypothetical protein